jgi:hypothetical protein
MLRKKVIVGSHPVKAVLLKAISVVSAKDSGDSEKCDGGDRSQVLY